MSILHNNIRSLSKDLEDFQNHLLYELDFNFSIIIGLTETHITSRNYLTFNPSIPGYSFEYVPMPLSAGSVAIHIYTYIKDHFNDRVLEKTSYVSYQAMWIEIQFSKRKKCYLWNYMQTTYSSEKFQEHFDSAIEQYSAFDKPIYIMGDFNINFLRFESCRFANNFLLSLQSYAFAHVIDKPTRVSSGSATLIDNVLINQFNGQVSGGNIVSDISDHFSQFCLLPLGDVKVTKMSNCPKYCDFSSFSQDMFLHDLNQIMWESNDDVHDIDQLFFSFFSKVNRMINKPAPLKIASKKKVKQPLKPWSTKGILKSTSMSLKNQFFFSSETEKYKFYLK